MVRIRNIFMVAILTVLTAVPSFADQVECSAECPEGQRLVSYGDGNSANCSCTAASAMDETVEDPNVDTSAAYD